MYTTSQVTAPFHAFGERRDQLASLSFLITKKPRISSIILSFFSLAGKSFLSLPLDGDTYCKGRWWSRQENCPGKLIFKLPVRSFVNYSFSVLVRVRVQPTSYHPMVNLPVLTVHFWCKALTSVGLLMHYLCIIHVLLTQQSWLHAWI